MSCQHLLELLDVKELILRKAQDLECLFFGNEAALYSEPLIRDVFSANVSVLCRPKLVVLL